MFSSFFYLEISFNDFFSFVGTGTIIAAVISIFTLIFSIRQNNNAKYLEFVKNTDVEFSQRLEKETSLKGRDECIIYAYNYIDLCDRIMFLLKKQKIPRDFFEYYLDFFNYAITMMWWYAKIYPEDEHSLKSSWLSLTDWIIQKNDLTPYPLMHLPPEMKSFLTSDDKEIDKNTIKKDLKELLKIDKNKNSIRKQ